MARADFKVCRYANCAHPSKLIDTSTEEYMRQDRLFYHVDCYEKKCAEENKKRSESADIQLIKNLWISNISNTVVIPELYRVLRELINRGVSTDYLVFVMNYVIQNHCKLNYPRGFCYYVDNKDIKGEYEKSKARKYVPPSSFVVHEGYGNVELPNLYRPPKKKGIGDILGGKR